MKHFLKHKNIVSWVLVSAIVLSILAYRDFNSIRTGLNAKATSLHRLVSQRADQHDAHLTGLSALASANEKPLEGMMLNLSETIRKFYSRIEHVDLIKLDKNNPETVFSTRYSHLAQDDTRAINDAAFASDGRLQIIPASNGYFLVKRSPNSDNARYGLALFINAEKLIENELDFNSNTQIDLKTNSGMTVYSVGQLEATNRFTRNISFSKVLGSRSQPLTLVVTLHLNVTDYIRWQTILPVILFMVLGIVFSQAFLTQRQKTRLAEERALLGEHEARIAQASRINGLGEMASGLAHEITQPLTAILSQSQAGVRLIDARPDDLETLKQVLGNISKQAKRGGDIVQRLRTWTTHSTETIETFDLNSVAEGIRDLTKADLKEKGVTIETTLHSNPLMIQADHVAIEQVIFNLSRNAVDAMEGVESGYLHLSTYIDQQYAIFMVKDNGKGIDEETLQHLFEPFYTTKEKGMGLGLSLCENIINRYNGQIEISNNDGGGVTTLVKLPLKDNGTGQ
ncbi:sensor histidine kinase [Sneathiella aquimaris]|uniref:sensor histidine kinase n=1 Tax=Sneathiella aquimaris TaxID=2599305 RepID=UPI00146B19DC|nr:ATP-binding protein [Sneathiella aquimaris]